MTTPTGTPTTTGSTTGTPSTVFGGAGTTLGPTGTTATGFNDQSNAAGLFTKNINFFFTFAIMSLWI